MGMGKLSKATREGSPAVNHQQLVSPVESPARGVARGQRSVTISNLPNLNSVATVAGPRAPAAITRDRLDFRNHLPRRLCNAEGPIRLDAL